MSSPKFDDYFLIFPLLPLKKGAREELLSSLCKGRSGGIFQFTTLPIVEEPKTGLGFENLLHLKRKDSNK